MTRGSLLFGSLIVTGVFVAAACVPVPPGLPPQSNEPVYVDAGPVEVVRGPSPEERARVRAEADARRLREADAGSSAVEQPADGKDPLKGVFTIADATASIAGTGALIATIDTSLGQIQCRLYEDKAPLTVANFVGLANGSRPYRSHKDGRWVKSPYFDGTTFHRVIKGFMIQGGDQKGNGTGEPGYTLADEIWAGSRHDRAGLLCMANRGKNTNGAQFFITDAASPGLDGNYTIFGSCSPTTVVRTIATSPKTEDDRPVTPVVIDRISVSRESP